VKVREFFDVVSLESRKYGEARVKETKRLVARSLLKRSWVEFAEVATLKEEHAQKHGQRTRQ
jgi:hypothetical protein